MGKGEWYDNTRPRTAAHTATTTHANTHLLNFVALDDVVLVRVQLLKQIRLLHRDLLHLWRWVRRITGRQVERRVGARLKATASPLLLLHPLAATCVGLLSRSTHQSGWSTGWGWGVVMARWWWWWWWRWCCLREATRSGMLVATRLPERSVHVDCAVHAPRIVMD